MACYVLWIPCLSEQGLTILQDNISERNISDTGVNFVTAKIDRNDLSISFEYKYKEQKHKLFLEYIGKNKDKGGLLSYRLKYCRDRESPLAKTMQEEMPLSIYHIIKDFFHKHTFHSDDVDSMLHARFFLLEKEMEKTRISNEEFFIKEYHSKFKVLFDDITSSMNLLYKQKDRLLGYKNVYDGHKRLLEKINQFKGEILYFETLSSCISEDETNVRKEIDEIRNWKRILDIHKDSIETRFAYNNALYGTKFSYIGIFVGIAGIILSIITALCS